MKEISHEDGHDNDSQLSEENAYEPDPAHKSSGKRKDDNFTEDSSVYVNGDEYTNANNINSNRHEINFDGIEALSDED